MPTPLASTVLKAFDVLGLFMERQVLSASQAAQLLNAPRASTHRMLLTLKAAGVLQTVEQGRYQLAMRLFELGSFVPLRRDLSDAAMGPLTQFAARTQLPVHLGVADGYEVLFLERVGARENNLTSPGERGFLHAAAAGKVLLAFSPEPFQAAYLGRPLGAYTRFTCTDPGRLAAELAQIRRRGLAFGRQERRVGFVSVAGPVRDRAMNVVASVSVVSPKRIGARFADLEAPLIRTCREIETRLRAQPVLRLRRSIARLPSDEPVRA